LLQDVDLSKNRGHRPAAAPLDLSKQLGRFDSP
jgi:hypothetical protein